MQWIRYTADSDNKTPFFIPFLLDSDDDDDIIIGATEAQKDKWKEALSNHKICKSAISKILDFRRT